MQMAGAVVPDFGNELGIDNSFDVRLPDTPHSTIKDPEIHKRELMGEQVEVFTDRDCGFQIAFPVVIKALVCFESAEWDQ